MKGPRQTWDMDLLKQHVSELSQQLIELKQEVRRLKCDVGAAVDARDKAIREVVALRRAVQDNHLRYSRLDAVAQLESDPAGSRRDDVDAATAVSRPTSSGPAVGSGGSERVPPSILDRISKSGGDGTGMPTSAKELPALEVHPGWGNFVHKGEAGVVVGISLLGLDAEERDRVIERIGRQQQRHKELLPVFITDDDEFESLRREHYVFEYLPPWPGVESEPNRTRWEDFLVGRLEDIRDKYAVQLFVSFAGQFGAGGEPSSGERPIEAMLAKLLPGNGA